jgi:single-stranded-DNA-specific exonuclease
MDTPYGNDSLFDLVMARRKITPEEYRAFDDGSHEPLAYVDEMCRILHDIHERNELIVVLPDFDCDGVMSGVIGYAGLSELGFNVGLFRPDPTKGYGFGKSEVDRLVSEFPGVEWVITCDTGIGEANGCKRLRELGVGVLVTDHHREMSNMPVRKYAACVVDPCSCDDDYELKTICGAHVLWQVLDTYARAYCSREAIDQIWRLRVFAGIGTVSDVMTLAHENRQLVRDAVSISRLTWSAGDDWFFADLPGCDEYRHAFYGLSSLFKAFAAVGNLSATSAIDEDFFGYYLAPAINSCKRLGHTTDLVFDIFFGSNQRACADKLVEYNLERKELTASILDDVINMNQPQAPYIYLCVTGNAGMLGLVAGKLCERSGMPTFLAMLDVDEYGRCTVHGSGRSPEWYPCLSRCTAEGFSVAGHEHAFGFSCSDISELNRLYEFLAADVPHVHADWEAKLAASGASCELPFDICVDSSGRGDVDLDPIALEDFIHTQDMYRPFGKGFEAPKFKVVFDWSEASLRFVGKHGEHVRIMLPNGIVVMCFSQAAQFPSHLSGRQEILGTVKLNEFRGETSVQFKGDCVFDAD